MDDHAKELYLRLNQVLEIIPVSRSTWYRGINEGIYPKQVKLSHKIAAWKLSEINLCVERIGLSGAPHKEIPPSRP